MSLPTAVALALWGTHFLRGEVSPDELIDHCGPEALALVSAMRPERQIEVILVAEGDLGGVTTGVPHDLLEAGAALLVGSSLLLAPDWRRVDGAREVRPTRPEAERLLMDAIANAHNKLSHSPIFGTQAPRVAEIEFPFSHPPRQRELMSRSFTTSLIAKALKESSSVSKDDYLAVEEVMRDLSYASRRGMEAAVMA